MERDLRRFQAQIHVADDFVVVENDIIADLEEAAEVQRLVRDALRYSGLGAVMFDSRGTVAPTDDVREHMWSWCEAQADIRIAIVVQSEFKRVSANMTATARRVRLRSFHDRVEATTWLISKNDTDLHG